MPHIHTVPGQHDTTASAIIVRLDGATPQILLHMHKKHKVLLQIGGHVELHETPWQAISHEIIEESGYDLSQLMILQPPVRIKALATDVLHPLPVVINTHLVEGAGFEHYHTDSIYVFVTNDAPVGLPDEDESQDLRWYSRDELTRPIQFLDPATLQICMFVLDTCIPKWETVPLTDFAV